MKPTEKMELLKSLANHYPDSAQGMATVLENHYANGGKVPEPKKVTVPKFVADWIEDEHLYLDLISAFLYEKGKGYLSDRFKDWVISNTGTFCRAILDGYKVEEKLHTVELDDHVGLTKTNGIVKLTVWYYAHGYETKQLTEQEIKDYDERYWSFAKEVTE